MAMRMVGRLMARTITAATGTPLGVLIPPEETLAPIRGVYVCMCVCVCYIGLKASSLRCGTRTNAGIVSGWYLLEGPEGRFGNRAGRAYDVIK
jgi:hypothetical protein